MGKPSAPPAAPAHPGDLTNSETADAALGGGEFVRTVEELV